MQPYLWHELVGRQRAAMSHVFAAALLAVSACSGQSARQLYTGSLQPVAGTCNPIARAQMVVRGNAVVFAPNSGTLVLSGSKSGNEIDATLTLSSAEKKLYVLKFEGTYHGPDIGGIYQDARCRYSVLLHPTSF